MHKAHTGERKLATMQAAMYVATYVSAYVIMYPVNMQIHNINILHLVCFGIENQQKHELASSCLDC